MDCQEEDRSREVTRHQTYQTNQYSVAPWLWNWWPNFQVWKQTNKQGTNICSSNQTDNIRLIVKAVIRGGQKKDGLFHDAAIWYIQGKRLNLWTVKRSPEGISLFFSQLKTPFFLKKLSILNDALCTTLYSSSLPDSHQHSCLVTFSLPAFSWSILVGADWRELTIFQSSALIIMTEYQVLLTPLKRKVWYYYIRLVLCILYQIQIHIIGGDLAAATRDCSDWGNMPRLFCFLWYDMYVPILIGRELPGEGLILTSNNNNNKLEGRTYRPAIIVMYEVL
jgi:hypothetical protein